MDATVQGDGGAPKRPEERGSAEAAIGTAQHQKERAAASAEVRIRQAAQDMAQAAHSMTVAGEEVAQRTVDVIAESARVAVAAADASAGAVTEAAMRAGEFGKEQAVRTAQAASQQAGGESTAALHRTREYAEQTGVAGAHLFEIWLGGAESSLRALLDMQAASLSVGIAVLDATSEANREALHQWSLMARQAQDAAMEAWKTTLRSATGPVGVR
jgi:hypothetical protein